MNNNFSTIKSINGDMVVGFTSSKEVKNLGWLDASKVSASLLDGENTHRKHLGLVNLFATSHKRPMMTMRAMLDKSAVLEVEPGESITYDLPVERNSTQAITTEDTHTSGGEAPGKGGAIFELVLNREYSKSSVLTYDPQFGQQCIVSDEHEVEKVGDSFRHYVTLISNDIEASWDPEYLKAGIEYIRVTNVVGEYDTEFANIDMQAGTVGTITNEFILGDPRALQTAYTAKAAGMRATGLNSVVEETKSKALGTLEKMGLSMKDTYFITKPVKDAEGKLNINTNKNAVKVGPILEYFVLAELAILEAQSLAYAKGGVIQTSFGVKRLNEGLWHQYRRGHIITYAREGGITLNHIEQAASYIFKNSDMDMTAREIKFKCGYMAYKNVIQLFRDEINNQLANLPDIFGNDSRVADKLFSGPLDNLELKPVVFRTVTIPGIGKITVEHDDSLNYQPLADRTSRGFYGNNGGAHTSFSMLIEDASSPEYSNVAKNVKGAELVKGGSAASKKYYIKPSGSHVVFGYEQGRMANEGQTSYVQSSLKTQSRTFWATSSSAALAVDVTGQVWIELER